jgi:hypothetical protein
MKVYRASFPPSEHHRQMHQFADDGNIDPES